MMSHDLIFWVLIGAACLAFFGGFIWGRSEERHWWTMAANSETNQRNVESGSYIVLDAQVFYDKYHNPLAKQRRAEMIRRDDRVRG